MRGGGQVPPAQPGVRAGCRCPPAAGSRCRGKHLFQTSLTARLHRPFGPSLTQPLTRLGPCLCPASVRHLTDPWPTVGPAVRPWSPPRHGRGLDGPQRGERCPGGQQLPGSVLKSPSNWYQSPGCPPPRKLCPHTQTLLLKTSMKIWFCTILTTY